MKEDDKTLRGIKLPTGETVAFIGDNATAAETSLP